MSQGEDRGGPPREGEGAAQEEAEGGASRPIAMPPPRSTGPSRPSTRIPRPPPRKPSQVAMPSQEAPPAPAAPPPAPPSLPPTANKRRPTLEYRPGELFAGRYRISRLVGKGGMGAVYLAEQTTLSRNVAIKLLHGTADAMTTARFQREARLIAQLQHPNIVNLIDFGDANGQLYLVMEYIDGEPLSRLVKGQGAMKEPRVLDLAIQMAEALAVAHGIGVIHRDVKPDNLMIMKSSTGREFVKVLDFGVAKISRSAGDANTIQTQAGMIVGSLRYISPEQLESKPVTARTDMYAFGCVVYEMLTGKRVFEYHSPADCALAHLSQQPATPAVDGQELRGPLVDLVMACLQKDPQRRPADAGEALKVLQAYRAELAKGGRVEAPSFVSAPARAATGGLRHIGGKGLHRGRGAADAEVTLVGEGSDILKSALDARRSAVESAEMAAPTAPEGLVHGGAERALRGHQPEAPRRAASNDVLIEGLDAPSPPSEPGGRWEPPATARGAAGEAPRSADRGPLPLWFWVVGAIVIIAFGVALGFFLSRQTKSSAAVTPAAAGQIATSGVQNLRDSSAVQLRRISRTS